MTVETLLALAVTGWILAGLFALLFHSCRLTSREYRRLYHEKVDELAASERFKLDSTWDRLGVVREMAALMAENASLRARFDAIRATIRRLKGRPHSK